MPAIKYSANGNKAFSLWSLTNNMAGDDAQMKARVKVRKAILDAWPELEEAGSTEEAEKARVATLQEIRSFDVSPDQQTALAEGFLKLMKDQSVKDGAKEEVLAQAKLCKVSGWLDKQTSKTTLREFTESDEEVESDPHDMLAARCDSEALLEPQPEAAAAAQ